jgi:hypothetical protein
MSDWTVHILTKCPSIDDLYGSALVFGSIRTGFPNASIKVWDNFSEHESRLAIRDQAIERGCEFIALSAEVLHFDFLAWSLIHHDGPLVFCDPDVHFWESMEGFAPNQIGGRLIPEFQCQFSGCRTATRLHTSLLFIEDTRLLRERVFNMPMASAAEFHPFRPFVYRNSVGWNRFDTGASLYHALQPHTTAFGERELNKYEHLFCGSNMREVAERMPGTHLLDSHADVKSNGIPKRGLWREQEKFFKGVA